MALVSPAPVSSGTLTANFDRQQNLVCTISSDFKWSDDFQTHVLGVFAANANEKRDNPGK
jgi:hypothetical protein